ncbi:class I adenylate-forming enzyme family protein [Thalassococcus sp. BH17M4-6]|uniref:class I adenylate-forming enzyme family protein n=1 Tax=Thalassococcus sp. BH17M4-6 TaxID=3413148 RepID=UPI003BDF2255
MTYFPSIPHALKYAIQKHANRIILQDADGPVCFGALARISDGIAAGLRRAGVGSGDRVVISMTASRWTWASFWAIWKLGAVPVAIGDLDGDQLRQTLGRAGAKAHVFNADRLDKISAAYHGDLPLVPLFADDDCGTAATNLRTLSCDDTIWTTPGPDDVASIVFSSGTTGLPKGIVHTQRSLLTAADNTAASFGLMPGDKVLSVNQIYHVWSQVAVILTGSLTACHSVLTSFSYPETLQMLEENGIMLMHAPPPVLSALAAGDIRSFDLSTLRRIITGGAPANVAAITKIVDSHPQIEVRNGYGCSEYILATMDQPGTALTPPGSSGAKVPMVDVKIVKPDASGKGEIAVRAPSMMRGYLDDPETTAKSFSGDYFLTGDLGSFEDGQLYVSGRLKDIVIVNGENVVPTEVEIAVNAFPGVVKSAAYGMPHPATGEAIRIKVVPAQGVEIDQIGLLAHLRGQLSKNKVPRAIEFVDAIAETATGKIIR